MTRSGVASVLVIVLALASLGLRLYGIDWGRPYSYHYDEAFIVKPAMRMVADGDWNPRFFRYPSGLIYAEAAIVAYEHHRHGLELFIPSGVAYGPSDLGPWSWPAIAAGRRLTATLGAMTVVAAGWLGFALGGLSSAVAVAALVAVLPLHVEHSHYLATDVPGTALALSALALVVAYGARGSALVGAGLVLGAAVATKYTLALAAPLIMLVAASRARDRIWRGPVLVAGAGLAGFFALCPYAILDWPTFVRELMIVRDHYRGGHLGSEGSANWLWYLQRLRSDGVGAVGLALLGAGGAYTAFRRRATPSAGGADAEAPDTSRSRLIALLILSASIAWFAWLGFVKVRFERNLIPALVLFCVPAGHGLAAMFRRARRRGPFAAAAVATILAAALVMPAIASVRISARLAADDTRTQALAWIQANLPRGAAIVREEYTPRPDPTRYRIDYVENLGEPSESWYRGRGFEYAIASGLMHNRILRDQRPSSRAGAEIYRWVFSHREVASFAPGGERAGPLISIFDLRGPDVDETDELR